MSFSEFISPFLGRCALAWFFLSEFISRAASFDANAQLMVSAHIPIPQLLLALALVVMALGGLSLLLGFHTRHGAVMLFGFTLVASMLMHNYWDISDATARAADYEIFARNVAIAGGLLLLVGMGPGPIAIDNREKGKKRR